MISYVCSSFYLSLAHRLDEAIRFNLIFLLFILGGIKKNNLNLIKKQIVSFFIVFIFLIFLSNIIPEIFISDKREFQLLEITQNIILIYTLILNFQFMKIFLRVSNLFTFIIRQSFILFILYEELSFITFSSNNYLTNSQGEFNLHNDQLFNVKLFSFTIPNTDLTFSSTLALLVFLSILFLLGYGSYFSCFKKIRYFFLDKQYSIYTFIYFADVTCSSILADLNIRFDSYVIQGEVLELFIYLLMCIDTLKKRKIMRENRVIE